MKTSYENTQHCIDVCNRLLRGELSAVETYNRAIEKFSTEPEVVGLSRIRDEHLRSVNRLEENVRGMGGHPDMDSGTWGTFAKAIQSTANLFGENSAVCTLRTGEKSGCEDYERALEDEDVLPECKEMIRAELLPRVQGHIDALGRIGERV